MGSSPSPVPPHVVIFPFLSKGHTIPLLHLAHLLHRRRLARVTFITTPLNSPFIRTSVAGTDSEVIELPFPENAPGIPPGVESTDQLPSMSLFFPFLQATKLLQSPFERALSALPTAAFLISDIFFGWTAESAAKFGIPRVMFSGMGLFSYTIYSTILRDPPYAGIADPNQTFSIPGFPHQPMLTRSDINPPFDQLDTDTLLRDSMIAESRKHSGMTHGMLANTFHGLEAAYAQHWDREFGPKVWCVGPLCLARPAAEGAGRDDGLMRWLDARADMNRPVLYVAFGTQAELPPAQVEQIELGLEVCGLDFLWVVRSKGYEWRLGEGFESRVEERGRVVREWVDQFEILQHPAIKGFVSHCGWNSVMESVCAGVPILAWPMMADQHLNAKFVVDELGIGLRIRARDGMKDGLVMHEDVAELARELILDETGKTAREKAKGLADSAAEAMMDGGSLVSALETMIEELLRKRRELESARPLLTPNITN